MREGCIYMLKRRIKSDDGLMGPTHALSAVALSLMVTWLASEFMLGTVIGSTDVVVFASAIIIITGSSLMPDLDAVNSTSISTLGAVGVVLSKAMRGFSSMMQSLVKGPYDKSSDPHRGFWHTFVAAGFIGLIISGLTSLKIKIFTIKGIPIMISTLIVMFIIYISIQLVLASLFKPFYKRNKEKFAGNFAIKLGSLAASLSLVYFLPPELSYAWVGAAVTFGWIAHLLGDMLTVSGVPILFPLKFKGKRWWNFRFPLGIKAGGFIEKTVLIPIFLIMTVIALFNIIPLLG